MSKSLGILLQPKKKIETFDGKVSRRIFGPTKEKQQEDKKNTAR